MSDNRRVATRHPVSLPAKMSIEKKPAEACTVVNLSLGGAQVTSAIRLAMGARVHINFAVPTIEDPIDIGAVVRWADHAGVGIQFDGLRARDVWALNKFFEQLQGS